MLFLRLPAVQKKMANEFTTWIEQEYQIQIQLDKIKLGILGSFKFEDFLLLDSYGDTLICIEQLNIQASSFSFTHIQKVDIEGLEVSCEYQDSMVDGELYKAIKPFFNSNKQSKYILIDNFWINRASIDYGNDLENHHFRELDLYLKDCRLSSETEFVLSNLNWEMLNGV